MWMIAHLSEIGYSLMPSPAAVGKVFSSYIVSLLLHPLGESDSLLGSSLEGLPVRDIFYTHLVLELSPPDSLAAHFNPWP